MRDWDEHYRDPAHHAAEPQPLLVRAAALLPPGRALDLACGAGRHALWLARQGWRVTAVDSSAVALDAIRSRRDGLALETCRADLEAGQFPIAAGGWELICDFYFLHRPLLAAIRAGVLPGGLAVAAIHLQDHSPGVRPMNPAFLLRPGELREAFTGWEILYYTEGREPGRSRLTAQIIARCHEAISDRRSAPGLKAES